MNILKIFKEIEIIKKMKIQHINQKELHVSHLNIEELNFKK